MFVTILISIFFFVFAPDVYSQVNKGRVSYDNDTVKSLMIREQAMKNPFADANTFTVNFADMSDEEWCYPLPGAHVISPYGGRRHHSGTDIKTKPNDSIFAAFSGVVTMSQVYYGYGNTIIIRHDNGLETLYSHQSKNKVKKGDVVKAGQFIGLTGRTGRATTEHLHFETRVNGKRFDSAKLYDHKKNKIKNGRFVFTKLSNGSLKIIEESVNNM